MVDTTLSTITDISVIISSIVVIVPIIFLMRKRKFKMYKDPSDYWEKFHSDTMHYFRGNMGLFEYGKKKSNAFIAIRGIVSIKETEKDNLSEFRSFLTPYIEMSIDWHEKRLTTNSVYDRCGDKLLILSKIKIIKQCEKNDDLYEELEYLERLICEIVKNKKAKRIKSKLGKLRYKLFNRNCAN